MGKIIWTDLQKNYLNTPNYQQYGTDGFSWVSHVDGTIITNHFRHVRQCSTVIKMKMTEIIFTVWYENSQNLSINFCNILNLLVLFTIMYCHLLAHLKHRGGQKWGCYFEVMTAWIGKRWNYKLSNECSYELWQPLQDTYLLNVMT